LRISECGIGPHPGFLLTKEGEVNVRKLALRVADLQFAIRTSPSGLACTSEL
jgi:hypothetical protein